MTIYNSNLIDIDRRSDRVIVLTFSRPVDFQFKAGQFVFIDIPDTRYRRAYSIASSVDEDVLRFIIDISPMGVGTSYLSSLEVGDSISFNGAWGHMVLGEDMLDKPIYFIATGTGVAPFISMLAELPEDTDTHMIYSEKYLADMIAVDLPSDRKTLSLTRESVDGYLRGRVTEYLDDISTTGTYFICGNKDMIIAVRGALIAKGCKANDINLEVFY